MLWEKPRRVDTGIDGGRNGASRVRSREFMATGLRDRRRNVGCRLRLSNRARERDAFVVVAVRSSLAPSRQSAALFKETRERARERERCLGKTTDNDRYSLECRRENTVPPSLHESAISIVGQFNLFIVNRSLVTRVHAQIRWHYYPGRNDCTMSDRGLQGSEFIHPRQEY